MKIPKEIIRPNICNQGERFIQVAPGTPFRDIHKYLIRNKNICLTGTYGFAMSFYAWLKKEMVAQFPVKDYVSSRDHRKALHSYQSRIWIGIRNHKPDLEKAPKNPWLYDFYPEQGHFYVTFADYLGMNGARQWYERGIQYPALDHLIHPFFGVYFPTRYEHLDLFDNWLYANNKFECAIDIGTGCGVLAFMMHKHGLGNIHATDINPNAFFSLQLELKRHGKKEFGNIHPEQASFLGSFQPTSNDLIVFNPPWIPDKPEKTMDKATYFEKGYFDHFFDEMAEKCPARTTLLIFFSNYAMLTGIIKENPIMECINRRKDDFLLISQTKAPVGQSPSRKKSWLQSIRSEEQVELYEVKRK